MVPQFPEVNRLIRIAEVRKAVELTVAETVNSLSKISLPTYSDLLHMAPNERRLCYCTALKVAAKQLDEYAEEMLAEAKRVKGP